MNENTTDSAAMIDRLQQCQKEQTKVTFFVSAQQIHGTVLRVDSGFVEVRCQGDEKALLRLNDVAAIFYK